MDNNEIIAYLLENERKRYEYAKELQKTLRWGIIGFLADKDAPGNKVVRYIHAME